MSIGMKVAQPTFYLVNKPLAYGWKQDDKK